MVFQLVSTQFLKTLSGLRTCLVKAKEHAQKRNFDPNCFLDLKLAPDMFPLKKQIQMVSDNAKGAVSRLSGKEAPVFEDSEKTFDDLILRISKTIEYLESFKSDDFKNYENQKASFPWYPGKYLSGHDYLVTFALPNFYFHVSMAYALLRNAGVEIGKRDYLGDLNWKDL
jgi:hypothetical protein